MQLSYLRCNARGRFDTSQLIEQIGFRHFWNMFHIRFDRIHFIGYELYAWRICTYAYAAYYAHACMHAYMHEVNWPWPLTFLIAHFLPHLGMSIEIAKHKSSTDGYSTVIYSRGHSRGVVLSSSGDKAAL